jgi:hypothetical protein
MTNQPPPPPAHPPRQAKAPRRSGEPSDAEIEAAAAAMMEHMFAPHELPLDAELQAKYRDNARGALTAAAAVRWQPIESAPKDEPLIMFGASPAAGQVIGFGRGVSGPHSIWFDGHGLRYDARWQKPSSFISHWMPLPAPPTDQFDAGPDECETGVALTKAIDTALKDAAPDLATENEQLRISLSRLADKETMSSSCYASDELVARQKFARAALAHRDEVK